MQLTDIKPNFISLPELEQRRVFEAYLSIRERDMTEPIVTPRIKGKSKKAGKQVKVTTEQYEILRKLGLI